MKLIIYILKFIAKILAYLDLNHVVPGYLLLKLTDNPYKYLPIEDKIIIFITGTNGKTTTTNYLYRLFNSYDPGVPIYANTRGNNLEQGILSNFIKNMSLKDTTEMFIFEVDEKTYVKLIKKGLVPDFLLLLNFSKDQVERNGLPNELLNEILELSKNKETEFKGKTHPLNVLINEDIITKFDPDLEGLKSFIIRNDQVNDYEGLNPELIKAVDASITNIFTEYDKNNAYFAFNSFIYILKKLGLDINKNFSLKAFDDSLKVAGRMEPFEIDGYKTVLNLAKNEVGLKKTIKAFEKFNLLTKTHYSLYIDLGNKGQDGKDLSWAYDYDYSKTYFKEVIISSPGNRKPIDFAKPQLFIANYSRLYSLRRKLIKAEKQTKFSQNKSFS